MKNNATPSVTDDINNPNTIENRINLTVSILFS